MQRLPCSALRRSSISLKADGLWRQAAGRAAATRTNKKNRSRLSVRLYLTALKHESLLGYRFILSVHVDTLL